MAAGAGTGAGAGKRKSSTSAGNGSRRTPPPPPEPTEPAVSSREILAILASAITSRAQLADRLGRSYYSSSGTPKRKLYEALGWSEILYYEDFAGRFRRQGVARRIVSAPPVASWSRAPIVTDGDPESPFSVAWTTLDRSHRIVHYLTRADIVAGIGRYGVLLLGLPGSLTAAAPETDRLLYLNPRAEGNAKISHWDDNIASPRYGKPTEYQLKVSPTGDASSRTLEVHHSRVIHIADNTSESDIYGTPRMEPVWNDLASLEMLVGGSAEMFWRGAFPGFGFNIDPEAMLDSSTDLDEEIQNYLHGFQRYMRLQGIDIKELRPQVSSPKDHVEVVFRNLAGATGIPQRILTGTERGELASRLDEKNWTRMIDTRRHEYCEPVILRPTVDTFIELGILPVPAGGQYKVEWLPLEGPADKDQAIVSRVKAEALVKYADSRNLRALMPLSAFLRYILGMSVDEVAASVEDGAEDAEFIEEPAGEFPAVMSPEDEADGSPPEEEE